MSDAVATVVNETVQVTITGSELLTPLVTAATAAKDDAETAQTAAEAAQAAAETARDEAAARTAEILRIMGRADLYGIVLLSNAAAFLSGGVEILPLASPAYYRIGGTEDTALADMPNITITRASTGYARTVAGTFTSFASGAARITDRGLLTEPAATNLFPRYAPTQAQLVQNTGTTNTTEPASPPISGLQWLQVGAGGTALAYQAITLTAATTYTASCLIETTDGSSPVGGPNNASTDFSFIMAGVVLTATTYNYLRLSGNTWLVWTTFTTAGSISSTNCGVFRQATQNTRTLKFSGFQVETGSRATSPIVTTGASATRAADVIQMTGLAIGQEVTVAADIALTGGDSTVTSAGRFIFDLDSGTTANRVYANNVNGALGFTTVVSSLTTASVEVAGTAAIDTTVKLAYRSKLDDFRMARDGTLSTADTSGAVPSSLTRVTIGGISTGANQLSGFIRRLVIIPAALTDAQLQTLTA